MRHSIHPPHKHPSHTTNPHYQPAYNNETPSNHCAGVKKVVAESYRHILRKPSFVTPDFSILAAALPAPIDYDKAVFPPWGIDRLNQPSLPLDNSYKPEYTGKKIPLTSSLSLSVTLPLSVSSSVCLFLCL